MKEFNMIQLIFTAVVEWFRWFLGGYDDLLYALFLFIAVDYITSMLCAIVDKKVSCEVIFGDIAKKGLIFLLVGISNILDVQVVIGTSSVLRTSIIYFYITYEGIHLLENAGHLGLPIPDQIKEIIEQLHQK